MTGKKVAVRMALVVLVVIVLHHWGCGQSKCEDVNGFEISIPGGQHKGSTGLCEVDLTEAQEAAARKAKRVAAEEARMHPPVNTAAVLIPEDPEFPRSGEGYATKKVPLKAWMDPMKSHGRPSKPAKYVVADHPSMYHIDRMDGRDKDWWSMPAGRYLVYPLEDDEVYFRWWQ